jgi:hypothetical protein
MLNLLEFIMPINLPTTIKASGSERTISIDPAQWADPQGFSDYLLGYAAGVILQRASAGKKDDPEKAELAVEKAIERLLAGDVPVGGGFTKLTPEDYAMKETLMAMKVKFTKGESVADVLARLATKLTEVPDGDEAATDEAIGETQAALVTELEASEVFKTALKARKSKGKTVMIGALIGQL